MQSVDDARQLLLNQANPVMETEWQTTSMACGRILAEPVYAPLSLPPWDNSAVDGYAIAVADPEMRTYPVTQRIFAGTTGTPLTPGTAARIFTGAPVPLGTTTIVMQEVCTEQDASVLLKERPGQDQHIRRRGEDVLQGRVVVNAGERISPASIGLISALGIAEVRVFRKLRIAIFSSGDELHAPGTPLSAGGIYDANAPMLDSVLTRLGMEAAVQRRLPDDPEAIRESLKQASIEHDLIVVSGGVSVGEGDHIKAVLEANGRLELWKVAMKPGKPLAFGHFEDTPVLALPGNPVSALMCLLLVARPYLLHSAGLKREASITYNHYPVCAGFSHSPSPRREFLRARIEDDFAVLHPKQGSAILGGLHWSTGVIDIPANQTVRPGDMVKFLPWKELWD